MKPHTCVCVSPSGGSAPSGIMAFIVHFFSNLYKESSIINALCISSLPEVSVGRRSGAGRSQAFWGPRRRAVSYPWKRKASASRLRRSSCETRGQAFIVLTSFTGKRKTSVMPIHFIGWKSNLSTLLCFYDTVEWCTGTQTYCFVLN